MHLKENVIFKTRKYGTMLYDVRNETKMKLNETATKIFFEKYIRRLSEDDIATRMNSKFTDKPYEEILNDVKTTLYDIESSDFMTEDDDNVGFINLIEIGPVIDNVIFEITKKCNLECKHCLEGSSHCVEELSTEQIFKLVDELSMLQVYRLVITGGEPLLREDLVQIIKRCTEKKIRVILFTNGTLITEEFLDEIKDCNIIIRFSIDGSTAETHDFIRGNGTFNITIQNMKLCKEKRIDIGIACTITKKNFFQYMDIVQLGNELEVKEIELSEVIAKGNALINKELLLEQPELEQLRIYNIEMPRTSKSFVKGMGFSRYYEEKFENEDSLTEYSCNAGISVSFISAEGEVYPCSLYKEYKEFCAGNVKVDNFSDIWESSKAFDKLRNLKVDKIESCVPCELFKACPGGCRAIAYASSGKLDGPMEEAFCMTSRNVLNKIRTGEYSKCMIN